MLKWSSILLVNTKSDDDLITVEKNASKTMINLLNGDLKIHSREEIIPILSGIKEEIDNELEINNNNMRSTLSEMNRVQKKIDHYKSWINSIETKRDKGIKPFKFNKDNVLINIIVILLLTLALTLTGVYNLAALAILVTTGSFWALQDKIEILIDKLSNKKETFILKKELVILDDIKAEVFKAEIALKSNGFIIDNNLKIDCALSEASAIITEKIIMEKAINFRNDDIEKTFEQKDKEKIKTLRRF